jgi:hypothetical protein
MTALYVPPTGESDHKKQNMSLQLIGGKTSENIDNIATNTAAIATLNAATYVNSFKTRTGVVVPVQGDYPTSLIPGTTTNDSATAGNIGEYIESVIVSGSAVSLVSGTAKNITSISLTAGDWAVNAIGLINPAGTTNVSVFEASISSTTGTRNTNPGFFSQIGNLGVVGSAYLPSNSVSNARFSLASTTTIFLVAFSGFTVSTNAAFGMLRAWRVR